MKRYVLKPLTPASNHHIEALCEALNPAQKEAVLHDNSPLLVIAGAGSGKTKTLVHRVARLVHQGVPPSAILLLTFTRKSSQEMIRRATHLLDTRCQQIFGGTFHSFGNIILREYADRLNLTSQFTILDRSDAEDLIQLIRRDSSFNKSDKRFPKKGTVASILSKSINTATSIKTILIADYPQFIDYHQDIERIKIMYKTQKQAMQVLDYDDLLVRCRDLLEQGDICQALQTRFQHILVDEYQDTNSVQSDIIVKLAKDHQNIMVVGDDSQSIYSFRGANFKNIMTFPRLFPNTRVIMLEQNYRSTQPILDLTNTVIQQARERYNKSLFTEKKSDQKPVYIETDSDNTQSRFICQKILELREEGIPLNEMAVLIRSGWHSNDLEVELKAHQIPFAKVGGFKFMETAHVKDILSYVKVLYNPLDSIGWHRILTLIEGIGPKSADQLSTYIQKHRHTLQSMDWSPFKSKKYMSDVKLLTQLLFSHQPEVTPRHILEKLLEYYKPLFQLKYDDHLKRQTDLESLITISERFQTIETFLTEMSLEPPDGSQTNSLPETLDNEKITLSTIHSAKGLEWKICFLLSAIDGFIPSFQSMGDLQQLEEERRLLYVALTRAKDQLFIIKPHLDLNRGYYPFQGMQFSKVSRFLDEPSLLDDHCEKWALVEDKKATETHTPSMNDVFDIKTNQVDPQPSKKYFF